MWVVAVVDYADDLRFEDPECLSVKHDFDISDFVPRSDVHVDDQAHYFTLSGARIIPKLDEITGFH